MQVRNTCRHDERLGSGGLPTESRHDLEWLLEEAEMRGLPSGKFTRMIAKSLVITAIRRFERKFPECIVEQEVRTVDRRSRESASRSCSAGRNDSFRRCETRTTRNCRADPRSDDRLLRKTCEQARFAHRGPPILIRYEHRVLRKSLKNLQPKRLALAHNSGKSDLHECKELEGSPKLDWTASMK